MSDAGDAKPARKNAVKSHADSGGGAMPQGGNQPPSAAVPAQQAAAAAQSSGDGSVGGAGGSGAASAAGTPAAAPTGAGAGASGAGSAASGAGTTAPGTSPGTSPGTPGNAANTAANAPGTQAQDPAVPVGIAQVLATTADTAADGAGSQVSADGVTAIPALGPGMPHATAMAAPPKAVPPVGAAATKPQDVAGKTGTPGAPVAKTNDTGKAANTDSAAAANDAASFSNTPAASTTPAGAAATDPTAQAIMAASAQTSASPPQSSSQADSETNSGVASPGALGAAGSPAAAVASSAMQAAKATAAAVTAATSASIAEALSASADAVAVAADKHTRGSGSDLSISGSSTDGSAGAAQLLTSATTSPSDVPTPTFKIPASVDTAEFGQGVADRVSLMMDGNLTSAKLQVNPPALGPIEVRIALQSGHAQVWFTSHSAVTRDALESSAPKLREMLGAQGFGQVSVDISQRSFQERSPQPKGYAASSAIGGVSAAAPVQSSSASSRTASGLLDAYA